MWNLVAFGVLLGGQKRHRGLSAIRLFSCMQSQNCDANSDLCIHWALSKSSEIICSRDLLRLAELLRTAGSELNA